MKRKVLIVDDHKRNIHILERLLSPDYEIRTAYSGYEALDTAITFLPDIVLLDIMMPGIDGYETCRQMRSLETLAGIKIIMVSARAMVSERLKGYESGADDYITKPFDLDELRAKVDVYMRLRSEEEVAQKISELVDLLVRRTESPLTYTRDAMYMLQEDCGLSEESHKLTTITQGCVTSVMNAIREIDTMTAINMSTLEFEPVPVSLGFMLESVQKESTWLVHRQGVGIELSKQSNVMVSVDEKHIGRAFLSLLNFLICSSQRGGNVKVELSVDTDVSVVMKTASPQTGPPKQALTDQMISVRIAENIIRQHQGTLLIHRNKNRIHGFEVQLPQLKKTEIPEKLQV